MAKKSITPSLRLNEDDYLKLRALKKECGLSWMKLISYANELLEKDMKKIGEMIMTKSEVELWEALPGVRGIGF